MSPLGSVSTTSVVTPFYFLVCGHFSWVGATASTGALARCITKPALFSGPTEVAAQ